MTIKISQLPNIAVISSATIIPVVDLVQNTPTTLRANSVQLQSFINAPVNSNIAVLQANTVAISYSFANVWSNLGNVSVSLVAGNVYADSKSLASNAYADSKSLASNAYAVTQAVAQSNAANAYATSKAVAQSNAANTYADSKSLASNAYAVTQAVAQSNAANAYTLSQISLASAGNYSNVNLVAYLGGASTVSIGGNLRITGNLQVFGNVTEVGVVMTTEYANSISVTGNIIAGLAQFASVNNTIIGNATPAAGTFTTLGATGNVIGGLGQFAAINSTPIGNATPSTGVFTTVAAGQVSATTIGNTGATVQGTTAQFIGNVIGGLAQFAAINSTPIGNATPSSSVFTYVLAGNLQAGTIGNTGTQFNGASVSVTTTNSTSQVTVGGSGTYTSTSTSTGGLIVSSQSGAGISGNVNISGNLTAGNGNLLLNSQGYLYNAPNAQQGLVQAQQYFALNSNLFVTSTGVGDVRLFGVNVFVAGNTVYEFETGFVLQRPPQTTTSHVVSFNLGAGIAAAGNIAGIATVANVQYQFVSTDVAATYSSKTAAQNYGWQANVSNVAISAAVTATTYSNIFVQAFGIFTVSTAGWLSPRVAFSAAPGGNYYTEQGSFFKITPLGPKDANVSVGTWAV